VEIAELRAYLLSRPGAQEDFPFGPSPLVAKVGGKMFALLSAEARPPEISLKCDPIDAQIIRDQFPAVRPGYHLSKRHWNTVILDGSVPDTELLLMVDQSHRLVVKGLTRAAREALGLG
jgi:predicted DNA-binding protein (MmcQ/YjbR family)